MDGEATSGVQFWSPRLKKDLVEMEKVLSLTLVKIVKNRMCMNNTLMLYIIGQSI